MNELRNWSGEGSVDKLPIKEQIEYDPESGAFRWRVLTPQRRRGWFHSNVIRMGNRSAKAYRNRPLAWYLMTGEWPNVVFCKDGDRRNTKWNNLQNIPHRGPVRVFEPPPVYPESKAFEGWAGAPRLGLDPKPLRGTYGQWESDYANMDDSVWQLPHYQTNLRMALNG